MPIAGPTSAPNDVRNFEAGMLLIGAGALLLFVSLFLEWFQRGLDAFEVFEAWDLILAALAITALVGVASRFGFGPPRPAGWLVGPAVAALVIVLFALVNPPPVAASLDDDPSTGLWLALAATVLMTAGAVLSVARISVAFAPAGRGVADPLAQPRAGVADPAGPYAPRAGVVDPALGSDPVAPGAVDPVGPPPGRADVPRGSRRFMGGVDPAVDDPAGAVPPTEPTRKI